MEEAIKLYLSATEDKTFNSATFTLFPVGETASQTGCRPGDPQGHLSPLRQLEYVLSEEHVLPVLWQ